MSPTWNQKNFTNQHFYWMLQLWSGSDCWLGIQLAWGSWHGMKWDAKFFLINVSRLGSIFTFCCAYFIVQYWNYHNPALILSKYPILKVVHLIKSIWTLSTATIHGRFSDAPWWYRNKLHSMDLEAETKNWWQSQKVLSVCWCTELCTLHYGMQKMPY